MPNEKQTKLKQFKKELNKFICDKTQEMGLHDYYEIKKIGIETIEVLEMIW